jgi:hypothetical protein
MGKSESGSSGDSQSNGGDSEAEKQSQSSPEFDDEYHASTAGAGTIAAMVATAEAIGAAVQIVAEAAKMAAATHMDEAVAAAVEAEVIARRSGESASGSASASASGSGGAGEANGSIGDDGGSIGDSDLTAGVGKGSGSGSGSESHNGDTDGDVVIETNQPSEKGSASSLGSCGDGQPLGAAGASSSSLGIWKQKAAAAKVAALATAVVVQAAKDAATMIAAAAEGAALAAANFEPEINTVDAGTNSTADMSSSAESGGTIGGSGAEGEQQGGNENNSEQHDEDEDEADTVEPAGEDFVICFHSNQLSIRGTEVALYDYAHYAETLLGLRSVILVPAVSLASSTDSLGAGSTHFDSVLAKFASRFPIVTYGKGNSAGREKRPTYSFVLGAWVGTGVAPTNDGLDAAVERAGCGLLYMIKSGANDGLLPANVPAIVHAVFTMDAPHGNVYAGVSEYLARYYEEQAVAKRHVEAPPLELQSVPHIVKPPIGCAVMAVSSFSALANTTAKGVHSQGEESEPVAMAPVKESKSVAMAPVVVSAMEEYGHGSPEFDDEYDLFDEDVRDEDDVEYGDNDEDSDGKNGGSTSSTTSSANSASSSTSSASSASSSNPGTKSGRKIPRPSCPLVQCPLRRLLGIPTEAAVDIICRTGGSDTFDLKFAQQEVLRAVGIDPAVLLAIATAAAAAAGVGAVVDADDGLGGPDGAKDESGPAGGVKGRGDLHFVFMNTASWFNKTELVDASVQYRCDLWSRATGMDAMPQQRVQLRNRAISALNRIHFLPGTADPLAKSQLVRGCDAMLHARRAGETFGLAVGEFAAAGKPVGSLTFNSLCARLTSLVFLYFVQVISWDPNGVGQTNGHNSNGHTNGHTAEGETDSGTKLRPDAVGGYGEAHLEVLRTNPRQLQYFFGNRIGLRAILASFDRAEVARQGQPEEWAAYYLRRFGPEAVMRRFAEVFLAGAGVNLRAD